MAIHHYIIILLVTFVALTLSLPDYCDDGTVFYGTCDPGPNCENRHPINGSLKCYSCSDGGFFPFEFRCDGVTNCNNGMDEKNCEVNDMQVKDRCSDRCSYCELHKDCCYRYCPDDLFFIKTVDVHIHNPICIIP